MTWVVGETVSESFSIGSTGQTFTRTASYINGVATTWNPVFTEISDGFYRYSYVPAETGAFEWVGVSLDLADVVINFDVDTTEATEQFVGYLGPGLGSVVVAESPGTRSQSQRWGPSRKYWAPSECVIPEDYSSSYGNGSTDMGADVAAMVTQAKTGGATSYEGRPIRFLPARSYVFSTGFVLPRSGSTPTNIVHLIGAQDRSSLLKYTGTSGAPISWESTVARTQHQQIENLTINLPFNAGVQHAIHYALSGTVTTEAGVSAQWMSFCHFENIVIEAQGNYQSGGLVKIEGGCRYTDIINVWGDPSQGTEDVLLLEFDYNVGSSGSAPAIGGDSVGFQWGRIINPISTIRRSGYSRVFKGRLAYAKVERGNCNGGRSGNGLYGTHVINGFRFLIDGLANEGQGEAAQMRLETCRYWRVRWAGLGTPDSTDSAWVANTVYALNARVVPTTLKGSGTAARNAYYLCTTAGTSHASVEPTWPASGTVADNTVVWTYQGAAVGDGLQLVASVDGRWEGRHATAGPVPFSKRLVSVVNADANSKRNIFSDFDLVEVTAGTASAEFTINASATDVQLSGHGYTGSLGSDVRTPYVVGSNPRHPVFLTGSKTFDWGNCVDGAQLTTTVTVTGAALGDFCAATMSVSLQSMMLTAYVSATDTVTCVLQNETGGAIDLASGTLYVQVRKAA